MSKEAQSLWRSICKGSTGTHLEYGPTYTSHLSAKNLECRLVGALEIRIDLSHNLRVRNKQSFQYIDSRELAAGKIKILKRIRLNGIADRFVKSARTFDFAGDLDWVLLVSLDGEQRFSVVPDSGHANGDLVLRVLGEQ